jgi:hypothetical protein
MEHLANVCSPREPWNKGKLVGQKAPFKLKEIWAIRVRLQLAKRQRELALFNLAIDSKLRACDLVKLRVRDVCHGQAMASPSDCAAAEDTAAGSVRNYGIDTRGGGGLDRSRATDIRGFSFSKPGSRLTPFVDAAIRPDRGFLGGSAGIGRGELRNAHTQED